MGIRIINQELSQAQREQGKIKARFKSKIESANTIAELKKCVKILSRHVFQEQDGE